MSCFQLMVWVVFCTAWRKWLCAWIQSNVDFGESRGEFKFIIDLTSTWRQPFQIGLHTSHVGAVKTFLTFRNDTRSPSVVANQKEKEIPSPHPWYLRRPKPNHSSGCEPRTPMELPWAVALRHKVRRYTSEIWPSKYFNSELHLNVALSNFEV